MVQRSTPRGKAFRIAEGSAGMIVKTSSSAHNDDSSMIHHDAHFHRPIISKKVLEEWDVLLFRRDVGRQRAYAVSKTEPQPKEVNPYAYVWSGREAKAAGHSSNKRKASYSSPPRTKQRAPRPETPETEHDENYVSDADDELDGVLDGQEGQEYYSQPVRVENLLQYYETAFKMIGQLGCKDIAKAWIKTCHPKKQTTNPYNGGTTHDESLERFGFAGALRTPDYWPLCDGWQDGKGCRHQEPDHIKKPERLILLIHLLRCGHPRFSQENLRLATAQIEREIPKNFTQKSVRILRQIYYARGLEIRHEQNGLDGDTVINLYMPKPTAKASKTYRGIVVAPIKSEPCRQVAEYQRSAKVTTADTDKEAPIEKEDPISAQMDLDSVEETEPIAAESTPASPVCNSASERLDLQALQLTQAPAQFDGSTVPKTEPSCIPSQRQWNRQPSLSHRETHCHTTARQSGDLSAGRIPRPFQKRGSTTSMKSSSSKVPMTKRQRASAPYQTQIPSRFSSTENHAGDGPFGLSEDLQTTTAHGSCQQPTTLSKTPMYPLEPPRRPVAPKPMSFSGSSSGFAGLPSESSWQTTNGFADIQQFGVHGSVYTDVADPNASLPTYPSDLTSSFGGTFSGHPYVSGSQTSNFPGPSQSQVQAGQQALDAEMRQHYPSYITSNFGILSIQPGPSDYRPLFPPDYTMGMGTKFDPHS